MRSTLQSLFSLTALAVVVISGGCVVSDASSSPDPAPLPPPPPVEAPPPAGRVLFYSEPDFRGEYFIVETGAAVENLGHLVTGTSPWINRIASFRIEGAAVVVAYTGALFIGEKLETSASFSNLAAVRRADNVAASWDHVIASLRVLPPPDRTVEVVRPAQVEIERSIELDRPVEVVRRVEVVRIDRRAADEIVHRAYRDILGRDADATGLRTYRERLTGDGWSEEAVRADLRRSPEFRSLNLDEVIAKAYREILHREADAEGARHYRDLLNRGWTIGEFRADLARSQEKFDKHVRDVITRAYRDILGRDPDPQGLATYERAVRDKAWNEQQIRDALARSPEARQHQK